MRPFPRVAARLLLLLSAAAAPAGGADAKGAAPEPARESVLDRLDGLFDSAVLPFAAEEDGVRVEAPFPYRVHVAGRPDAGPRPLVVFLHGAGQCGTDNRSQLRLVMPELVDYAERRNLDVVLAAPQIDGREGFFRRWTRPRSQAALEALIGRLVETSPVDPDRVYLTGISLGGMGTWSFLGRRPDLLAAAMPVCGNGRPEALADRGRPREAKDVPVWTFHGEADHNVKVEETRALVRTLRARGGAAYYSEWELGGHAVWPHVFRHDAVLDWLFAQRRGRAATPPARIDDPAVGLDDEVPDAEPRRPERKK